MFTDGPTALVGAGLRQIRPVAHEIVVAVDERVPIEQLGPIQAAADRVVRAEFVPPLEANLRWLHSLATGDWILRLDGDDLASTALVRRLATPGWDVGITHAYVQYRWLWGGDDRMLDQAPWWPDPALRLIRNLPGIAAFPQGAHEVAQVAGAARFWDEPLYHLDLLVTDEASRAAKATAYELQSPGKRTDRGWSVSTTYYLPERLDPPPRTSLLPDADAAVVAAALSAHRSAAPLPAPTNPAALAGVVTAADRRTPAPQPGDVRVRILATDPVPVVAGRSAIVTVGVTNSGTHPLDPHGEPPEVLGGQLFDDAGAQVGFELREPLPGAIGPGEEALVRLPLPPWLPAGAARLRVGVVQDDVGWHDGRASVGLRVQRGRRVLVRTGLSSEPHLGDDIITREVLAGLARHLPDVVPVLLAHPTDSIAERFGCEVAVSPASLATPSNRAAESSRRSRDLVNQARKLAKGQVPADPAVAEVLEPFAAASALVLAPGGGLASRYSAEALMVCATEALIARAFDLPVLIEAPSIGPIEVRRDHAALGQLLNQAARLTVRDRASADAARRIGRAVDPLVVPDPATAATAHIGRAARAEAAAWLAARNVPADRAYALVSLRDGFGDVDHVETVRRAVQALPEHTALIYVPHCWGPTGADDLAVLRQDEWAGAHLVPWDPSLPDATTVALVAGALLTLGTRFHLSVLAAAAGVRAVGLVADEYDRLRMRALRGASGVRVVERDDPAGAAEAVAALIAAADPEPIERWDAEAFAGAVGAVLPPAPRLI